MDRLTSVETNHELCVCAREFGLEWEVEKGREEKFF